MAVGLSKNSPIQLKLTRENYEALISRHGQYIRWVQSNKCTCLLKNGYPNPDCIKCNGDGLFYTFQLNKKLYSKTCTAFNGFAYLDTDFLDKTEITNVFINGLEIKDFSVDENIIFSDKIKKTDSVTCHGITSREKTKKTELIKIDSDGKIFAFFDDFIQSETYKIYPDITKVNSYILETLENTENENITTDNQNIDNDQKSDLNSFDTSENSDILDSSESETKAPYIEKISRNFIYFSESIKQDKIKAVVSYILPEKFLVHSQVKKDSENKFLDFQVGDSEMTYPYEFDISKDDVITLLFANKLEKVIISASGTDIDTLPDWFVSDIKSISDFNGLKTDFILFDRNKIKWLKTPPEENTKLSVVYHACISYRVSTQADHYLRSAENQLLPKMVALKQISVGDDEKDVIENVF